MSIWTVIYRAGVVAAFVLLAVVAALGIVPKWRAMQDYRRRKEDLERQIAIEEELTKLLRQKQERFRTDPRFVERIAHDLGLARSNEILYRIVREPGGAATNRARSSTVPRRGAGGE
ncbi:MAG: septum formation initiator family protein [Kiritimatiellae bacterium]|nr:septum formation initiator family protein [Kiritimatiellia bacterium]